MRLTLNNTGVTDLAGNAGMGTTTSSNYTVDTTAPTAIITMDDTSLRIGDIATVTITFSEAVTDFTVADLTAANGTVSGLISSDSGKTWTATFTPTANITDDSNLITLDNTGVKNLAGNTGVGVTHSGNFTVDTARPTASIVLSDTSLRIGDTATVTITFSEAVTGFTIADLNATNGVVSGLSSSNGGVTWTANFIPTANITDATNLITLDNTGVTDLAGNAGIGTFTSSNYAIDTVRPTATIVMDDTSLNVGETTTVTITFSEAVTGLTVGDLTVDSGTVSSLSSSDGGVTWTATFTPEANISDATNVITLDNTVFTDLAGNAGTGTTTSSNYTVDTTVPTAIITMDDISLRIGDTATVTITYSEAVTDFTVTDLTAVNGTVSGLNSSDSGKTWTATFTPAANITDDSNLITLDNTGVKNLAGNTGVGVTNSGNYVVDTVRPTASILTMTSSNGDHVVAKVNDTVTLNITTNEEIQSPTITIATHAVTVGDAGDADAKTWTASYVMLDSDTTGVIPFTFDFLDIVGNAGAQVTAVTVGSAVTFDKTKPILTAGMVTRTSNSLGTVKFTSDEVGQYYYEIVEDGAGAPAIDTSEEGTVCTTGEVTITNPIGLTAGEKDIYIKMKDGAGNESIILKMDIPVYVAPTPTAEPPSTPISPQESTTVRRVEVNGVNHSNTSTVATVDIVRKVTNDSKVDTIVLDQKKTGEILQKLVNQQQDIMQIVVNDIPDDKADEVNINLNENSVQKLSDYKVALEIKTEEVSIQVPKDTIKSISESGKDLYFRVVPIKDEDQQKKVIQNAVNAKVVQTAAGSSEVVSLGTPMTIETNYQNLTTKITFSLEGITLPTDTTKRKEFLSNLGVYINHSDGEQELNRGVIVYDEAGNPIGIEIEISKFSTFTIVGISNSAPVAANLKITGKAVVGNKLTATYTYRDIDKDRQGKTKIAWYRADNKTGKNKILLNKGSKLTYKITKEDQGKYIIVKVTPIAITGDITGATATEMIKVTAIGKTDNNAPIAESVLLKGKGVVGNKLTVTYNYKDAEKDKQGKTTYRWYRADNAKGSNKRIIKGAIKSTYTLVKEDIGNYIFVEITPVAKSGTAKGVKAEAKLKTVIADKPIQYMAHVKLGLIGDKSYSEKVAKLFEQNYKDVNVVIKTEGKFYRIYIDFVDEAAANSACKEMKQKEYIINYSYTK